MSSSWHARMMRTAISPRLATSTLLTRRARTASRFCATLDLGVPVRLALLEERGEAFLALIGAAQSGDGTRGELLHVLDGRPRHAVDELLAGGDRLRAGLEESVNPAIDDQIEVRDIDDLVDESDCARAFRIEGAAGEKII